MTRALDHTGHLTDEAVVLLADGALPASEVEAARHLDACDMCAGRVADAALLSLAAHTALRDAREREHAAVVVPPAVSLVPALGATADPSPSPRWPLLAGALLLVAAVVPTMALDVSRVASTGRFLRSCASVLARGMNQAAHREAGLASSLGTWLLACSFALVGVLVARVASRSKNRSNSGALS